MRDVYVLGVGMIKFGRYPDKDVPQLGAEAAVLALKDADIGVSRGYRCDLAQFGGGCYVLIT